MASADAVHDAHAAFTDALDELVPAQASAQVCVLERRFLLIVQVGTQVEFPFCSSLRRWTSRGSRTA